MRDPFEQNSTDHSDDAPFWEPPPRNKHRPWTLPDWIMVAVIGALAVLAAVAIIVGVTLGWGR